MTVSKRMKVNHNCTLNLGSDSKLPKATSKLMNVWREVRKLGQMSERHPLTFEQYRSYPAVVSERHKLLLEKGHRVIHPLSLISLIWTTFMIFINLAHMVVSPLYFTYIINPVGRLHDIHPVVYILTALHIVCLVDVIVKFNTGYVADKMPPVMRREEIAFRYFHRWFICDVASSLPLTYIFLRLHASPQALLFARLLPMIRTAKFYIVVKDFICFLKLFTPSYIVHDYLCLIITFVVTSHWCSCLIYFFPVANFYYLSATEEAAAATKVFAGDLDTRYNLALIISLSSFFGTGFSVFRSQETTDILIHSFIICYGTCFTIFFLVYTVKSYMTVYQTSRRYQGLIQQVEQYMNYRQFPVTLKKRLRAFYQYRYQNLYFKERAELDCLSKELGDKIRLYTCRSLVDKVKLFEGAPPSVVGAVLGCLKPEVYLYNDLVVRAGEIGDCMYFIDTGTVAVYSLKGVEVCHLEDGAHFGEVALIMMDSKRVATVVAVETTLLYRLDVDDFRSFIMSHATLSERIQTLASHRMLETVLVDKAFRREKKLSEEQQSAELAHASDVSLSNHYSYQFGVQSQQGDKAM